MLTLANGLYKHWKSEKSLSFHQLPTEKMMAGDNLEGHGAVFQGKTAYLITY